MVGRSLELRTSWRIILLPDLGNIAALPLEMSHGEGAYRHPSFLFEMQSINMLSGIRSSATATNGRLSRYRPGGGAEAPNISTRSECSSEIFEGQSLSYRG